ncbi:tetratricopeptide repeat protein [Arachnia propionica]|uniref:Sel1 repeat family protein n=1 Tax=Arachnia propionica TaxID=1750 RepID=A0A3P1WVP0_9ACTN|nr:tetratricopeptide repeat protein [Arachnia propionica]RRD50301.1 sel1 repeat family protein [Arachnia propionica]
MVLRTSIKQLQARAESGDPTAMLDLANWYFDDADLEDEAMEWWRRAAEAGEAEAAFNLGSMLEDDDPGAALSWYERGAEAGHTDAKVNAGTLLADGGDFVGAARWWVSAAEDGDTDAMYNLGQLADRDGSAEEAERWWLQAARRGHDEALQNLVAQCEELHDSHDPRTASLADLILATLAEAGLRAAGSLRRDLEQWATIRP